MRNWKSIATTAALAALTFLIAACSDVATAPIAPSDLQQVDMQETIQRLQQTAPQLQQQLDQIEKLNPGLESNCSPAYPQKCIPPAPPVLDCKDVGQKNFLVLSPDPHNFDPDGNGIGCED